MNMEHGENRKINMQHGEDRKMNMQHSDITHIAAHVHIGIHYTSTTFFHIKTEYISLICYDLSCYLKSSKMPSNIQFGGCMFWLDVCVDCRYIFGYVGQYCRQEIISNCNNTHQTTSSLGKICYLLCCLDDCFVSERFPCVRGLSQT